MIKQSVALLCSLFLFYNLHCEIECVGKVSWPASYLQQAKQVHFNEKLGILALQEKRAVSLVNLQSEDDLVVSHSKQSVRLTMDDAITTLSWSPHQWTTKSKNRPVILAIQYRNYINFHKIFYNETNTLIIEKIGEFRKKSKENIKSLFWLPHTMCCCIRTNKGLSSINLSSMSKLYYANDQHQLSPAWFGDDLVWNESCENILFGFRKQDQKFVEMVSLKMTQQTENSPVHLTLQHGFETKDHFSEIFHATYIKPCEDEDDESSVECISLKTSTIITFPNNDLNHGKGSPKNFALKCEKYEMEKNGSIKRQGKIIPNVCMVNADIKKPYIREAYLSKNTVKFLLNNEFDNKIEDVITGCWYSDDTFIVLHPENISFYKISRSTN